MFDKPINRWWTVVGGALGSASGGGVLFAYVLGIFIKSISAEFDWDRSFTTAGMSLANLVNGIGCLVFGAFLARWSLRSVSILFVFFFALLTMAIALLPKSLLLFCLVFSLMGFFAAGAGPMPYALVISRQFNRNRGIALALMVSGTTLGTALLPAFSNALLEDHGWRASIAVVGAVMGLAGLSGLVFFLREPRVAPEPSAHETATFRQVFRSGAPFWIIALSVLSISIALIGLITNLYSLLTDRGIPPAKAASLLGMLGATSIISRLAVGALLDRLHARYLAAGIFLVASMGAALVNLNVGGPWLYVAVFCLGLSIGAEVDLVTYITSRYFPISTLSLYLSVMFMFWGVGNAVGIAIGSLSYDLTGSYDAALALFTASALLSSILIFQLGAYQFSPRT